MTGQPREINYLVVEPTHLKNICQNGNLPPIFGVNFLKKMKPPPSIGLIRPFLWEVSNLSTFGHRKSP